MGHRKRAPTEELQGVQTLLPWLAFIPLVLTHCAPIEKLVSLDHVHQVPVIHHTEPVGSPELRITTHTDGLGWSVQPVQRLRRYVDVTQQETWKIRVYPAAKTWRIPKLVAGWVTCPTWGILGMTGLALADPGAPMWRRSALYEPCALFSGGDAYSAEATMMRKEVSLDRRIEEEDQPVTAGSLALVWQLPDKDPLGIDIPLSPQQTTIAFRARWIANVLMRQGIEITDHLSGHAEVQLRQPGAPLISHPIPLTSAMLRTAIEQEAARGPADRWPSRISIRTVVEVEDPPSTLKHARSRHICYDTLLGRVWLSSCVMSFSSKPQTYRSHSIRADIETRHRTGSGIGPEQPFSRMCITGISKSKATS